MYPKHQENNKSTQHAPLIDCYIIIIYLIIRSALTF